MEKAFDLSKLRDSRGVGIRNKAYLDLVSVITRARHGFAAEQSRLVSAPAKQSASQVLRQLDLITNMVNMPHLLLMNMEGHFSGLREAFDQALVKSKKDFSKRSIRKGIHRHRGKNLKRRGA